MTSLLTKSPPLEEVEQPAQRETPVAVPGPREKPARLVSLDAYRGAIMLFMASGGLALPEVAKHFPDDPVWRFLAFNTDHVPWIGCSLWDLIQPSFMFMVGVAMPYSIASRRAKGDSEIKITFHVLYRAIFLVLLAIFLSSNWSKRTNFVFTNVLAQIGLGYAFLYLLLGRGVRVQLAALGGILIGYWLLFFLWPLPAVGFDYHSVGWKDDWQGLPGQLAHWDKNTNAAAAFDSWFLNLFPPAEPGKPFRFNEGGYQTLNFVPSLATMLLGLLAGEMLRTPKSKWQKLGWLVLARSDLSGAGLGGGRVRLSDRQAHLDAVVGAVQRRLDVLDAGRLLLDHRHPRLEALGVSTDRRGHELHRHVLHGPAHQRLDRPDLADPPGHTRHARADVHRQAGAGDDERHHRSGMGEQHLRADRAVASRCYLCCG